MPTDFLNYKLKLNYIMAKVKTPDADKLAVIEARLKFAEANTDVPYLFKVSSGYDRTLTDAKDKQMANGNYLLPATYNLNYDKGDGKGLSKHIIIFKGSDSVTESHVFYRNANGKFEEPGDVSPIVFEDYQKAVYGDSLPNLRLIEYLSLIEQFSGSVHCQDLTESFKSSQPVDVLTAAEVVKVISLIGDVASTEAGFEIIKAMAKNPKLNDSYQAVDGLSKMEGGNAQITGVVQQLLLNPVKSKIFLSEFRPSRHATDLVNSSFSKKIVGYNKKTKSFHLLNGQDFDKEALFTIDAESDDVKLFMFTREVSTNSALKVKLQNILSELSK